MPVYLQACDSLPLSLDRLVAAELPAILIGKTRKIDMAEPVVVCRCGTFSLKQVPVV
jgi:hypothetical protein